MVTNSIPPTSQIPVITLLKAVVVLITIILRMLYKGSIIVSKTIGSGSIPLILVYLD
jgi:hypothetical protein